MCFRPVTAQKGARICSKCRKINDDPEATVCEYCGAELAALANDAAPLPPDVSQAAPPPKAPPPPPKPPQRT